MPPPGPVLPQRLFPAWTVVLPAGASAAEDEPFPRPDSPPVLERASAGEDAAAPALLEEAWRAAGSPRLAILWERTFDDRLSDFETDSRLCHRPRKPVRGRGGGGGDDGASRDGGGGLRPAFACGAVDGNRFVLQ